MSSDTSNITVVAGPPGIGKTTWISQFLSGAGLGYLYPGAGAEAVDRLRIGYRFPQVSVIEEDKALALLTDLPDSGRVYVELGFHIDLAALPGLPCHRVAVVPPGLAESEWHSWADEVVIGNNIEIPQAGRLSSLWRAPLTGQVFDPPSLDELLIELTGGAYGRVMRLKGIFELPDGQAFYVDFVEGIPGLEYTELKLPRWLEGRPSRLSSLEVVGYDLQQNTIKETLLITCLSDEILVQYQRQYQQHLSAGSPLANSSPR
ncbi:GTP-binding protein [Leptolyngbya cf. ectocarpi LEGE 11479]|uniref:GTP-binding protein n=1 Tax=Leptolyngbya cf. ectocarpi LEGE 11479 TaxID=1828722 RepID=A0A928ZV30_LEPEC|nr:GTP-binding protein [Leptolyngbya ectocarpi]MBE9067991.1 GTP-binding protein [Leptolyngbya cf. ectocarpi LEGE 11479]